MYADLGGGHVEPCMGPVINYGEGATNWENFRSKTFRTSPLPRSPLKQGKSFPVPQLKGVELFAPPPPTAWLKLKCPMLKLHKSLLYSPFNMAKTFSHTPFYCRGKTSLAPLSLFLCSPPPLPVFNDRSLAATACGPRVMLGDQ